MKYQIFFFLFVIFSEIDVEPLMIHLDDDDDEEDDTTDDDDVSSESDVSAEY